MPERHFKTYRLSFFHMPFSKHEEARQGAINICRSNRRYGWGWIWFRSHDWGGFVGYLLSLFHQYWSRGSLPINRLPRFAALDSINQFISTTPVAEMQRDGDIHPTFCSGTRIRRNGGFIYSLSVWKYKSFFRPLLNEHKNVFAVEKSISSYRWLKE